MESETNLQTRNQISVQNILKLLSTDCHVLGNMPENFIVKKVVPANRAEDGDMTFIQKSDQMQRVRASVVICPKGTPPEDGKLLICCSNPRLWFIRLATQLFEPPGPYIEVGKDVYLSQGVVLGSEGFGYERDEEGKLLKFPHYGGVIIGDNVEIGANTCIDRGSLDDTVIGSGTKIDNLVHVGHNAKIGRHCLLTALSLIGGSAEIGDYVTIWSAAVIKDHVKIGHHAVVGAGAVVINDVAPNSTVIGVPARDILISRKDNK